MYTRSIPWAISRLASGVDARRPAAPRPSCTPRRSASSRALPHNSNATSCSDSVFLFGEDPDFALTIRFDHVFSFAVRKVGACRSEEVGSRVRVEACQLSGRLPTLELLLHTQRPVHHQFVNQLPGCPLQWRGISV